MCWESYWEQKVTGVVQIVFMAVPNLNTESNTSYNSIYSN